ncbi:isatin hydrolase-like [Oratosquilla oratoria]|uniref:isatin hydrolase-like n=1 Tax=Oratosquilla oratoria TaxID=337810 RepID=UPI003F77122F
MVFLGVVLFCWCEVLLLASGAPLLDLDYAYNNETMTWPGNPGFRKTIVVKEYNEKGFWLEGYALEMAEHSGTHMDAPKHFGKDKWTVDQIPLERLIGPVVVMDISEKVSEDPIAELSADDVTSWLETNGQIPDGAIVLVRTGWGKYYGNKTAYFGPDWENGNMTLPGISPGAANLFVDYERMTGRRVVGVGLDTPSLDHGPSTTYETHQILSEANIYGLENVANLEQVPTKGAMLMVMPMKVEGGSGAPTRLVLTLPETSAASSLVQPQINFLLASAMFIVAILVNPCFH